MFQPSSRLSLWYPDNKGIMNTYPKVSIIVLNWNRPGDTLECLGSIFELDYPNYEVIVVDNGSTDKSVQCIREHFPQVVVIENEKNLGFTGGNNLAMEYASKRDADYFWLVNNDATTDPDTLKKLVETADKDAKIGLISPVVYFYGESDTVQFCGINLDLEDFSFHDISLPSIPDGDVPIKVNLLVGTALLIKRRVVDDIGYLDDKYFAYVEDFEYCMRAKRYGYLSMVVPSARVYHKDSQWKVKKRSPLVVFLRSRNTYYFWQDTLNGQRRKFQCSRIYFADRISFFAVLRKENRLEAADACLNGTWAAIRGIGGPWDQNVRMPRIVKRILSWHPYFWVGLLRGDVKATLNTTVNRLREKGRDLIGGNDTHRP